MLKRRVFPAFEFPGKAKTALAAISWASEGGRAAMFSRALVGSGAHQQLKPEQQKWPAVPNPPQTYR
jgi:hypothetical protein